MKIKKEERITVDREVVRLNKPTFVGGELCKAGTLVELDEIEAQHMISIGFAVAATESEATSGAVIIAPKARFTKAANW
jgi:hypothetical protein